MYERQAEYTRTKTYYITCPNCGSNLDPGEICDCTKDAAQNVQEAKTTANTDTIEIKTVHGIIIVTTAGGKTVYIK